MTIPVHARAARVATWSCVLAALACVAGARAAGAAAMPLKVLREVPMTTPGTPRALAFAPDGGLAYVAVGRKIAVYETTGVAPVGEIALPGTVTALSMAPAGDRAYAALENADAVAVLSLRPLRVLRMLRLSIAPSALVLDAAGRTLYVESATAGSVLKLDTASGRISGSVRLDGQLQQMAANDYGSLFVAVADRDMVDVLDSGTLRLAGRYPLPGCHEPSGLALDPVGRRLFVACSAGGVSVVDTDVGFTFQRLPSAAAGETRGVFVRPAAAVGWKGAVFFAGARAVLDAVRMLAFIRYADGGSLGLPGGSEVLAFDAAHGRLWVALSRPTASANAAHGVLLTLGAASTSSAGDQE